MEGRISPSTLVRLETRLRANKLARYPFSRHSFKTRSRVSGRISGAWFKALDTVVTETPAILAISLIVTCCTGVPPS